MIEQIIRFFTQFQTYELIGGFIIGCVVLFLCFVFIFKIQKKNNISNVRDMVKESDDYETDEAFADKASAVEIQHDADAKEEITSDKMESSQVHENMAKLVSDTQGNFERKLKEISNVIMDLQSKLKNMESRIENIQVQSAKKTENEGFNAELAETKEKISEIISVLRNLGL